MKDPVEVQLPSSDGPFVILRMEQSRDWISPALFNNPPLDLGNGPAIEHSVSRSLGVCIADSTHVVSCSIAWSMD